MREWSQPLSHLTPVAEMCEPREVPYGIGESVATPISATVRYLPNPT